MTTEGKEIILNAEHLCKYFKLSRKEILKAVDDVSFCVYKRETLGVVGESGCGKSTLGRCLVHLYEPDSGNLLYHNQPIRELKTKSQKLQFCKNVQMIFQNPYASLNPRMTVKEVVEEGIKIHSDMNASEREEKVLFLLEKVGLGKEHISRFAHEFSGGQKQRIGIARALSVDPEFIVCDEPISALDVSIQAQVINMLRELQEDMGLTYLFIAHDLNVVKYISDRILVMYLGNVVEIADSDELYKNPLHPYTQMLLSAIPVADPILAHKNKEIPIQGEITSPINPKPGCKFAGRCPYAMEVCHEVTPQLKEIDSGHQAACHLYSS